MAKGAVQGAVPASPTLKANNELGCEFELSGLLGIGKLVWHPCRPKISLQMGAKWSNRDGKHLHFELVSSGRIVMGFSSLDNP